MRIMLLTVGKTVVPWVKEGLDVYASRLKHYIPFEVVEIPELKDTKALTEAQIKEREGALILKSAGSAELILLDEHGRSYRSVDFAKELQNAISHSSHDICFVVGGAYGFSPQVYAKASGKISLSPMTFNHQMVRTIFAEQLYRAFTIMRGEPYHHE